MFSPIRGQGILLRYLSSSRTKCTHIYPHRNFFNTPPKAQIRSSRTQAVIFFGVLGVGCAAYFFLPDTSRSAPTSREAPLSASYFTPAILTSSSSCGPDTKLLTLTVPPHLLPPLTSASSTFTPIWSVFIKDDDIQVERPYTPLEGVDEQGRMSFYIKRYPQGEVGRWLHSKNVGDQVELRGPLRTWEWQEGVWDEVVMISGGTGITPFYQLFHTVISRTSASSPPHTRFTLLHCSRTPADLPPPAILHPLISHAAENPERFRLHLFVDSLRGPVQSSIPMSIPAPKVGRIGKSTIQQCLGGDRPTLPWWQTIFGFSSKPPITPPKNILFLICGPEQMVNKISGPYGRNFSQGPVGGILGEMGYTSSQVWKL